MLLLLGLKCPFLFKKQEYKREEGWEREVERERERYIGEIEGERRRKRVREVLCFIALVCVLLAGNEVAGEHPLVPMSYSISGSESF